MQTINPEEGKSTDIVSKNINYLKELFPEAFTECGVNFDVFRQLLGDAKVLDEGKEKYGLNWHGKKKARQIALTPSTATLLPCQGESVDWNLTKNLFIEGDNLEVLKLLQKSYSNKVKMIFIDPPYNTGEEFIYPDKFSDNLKTYLKYTGQVDDEGVRFSSKTEVLGRKHTNWLSMMYPRLMLAKNLLIRDGVIFICIDDNEVSNLRNICDEIFGEENFIAGFIWEKRTNRENRKIVSSRHDYIVCYCKELSKKEDAIRKLPMSEKALSRYKNHDKDPRGKWKSDPATAQAGHATPSQFYILTALNGKEHHLQSGRCWLYTKEVMEKEIAEGRIWFGKDGNGVPRIKTYLDEKERGLTPESIWFASEASTNESAKTRLKALFGGKAVFETPKPVELVELAIKLGANDGIVLDFFAGSCTSAEAAMRSGNRFIVVQLPEKCDEKSVAYKQDYSTIADIGKDRLRRVSNILKQDLSYRYNDTGFKVFKLSYSNICLWNPDHSDLESSLLSHESHLVECRSEEDVLYELLLKRGVDLAVPIESREISDKKIYSIGYGVLFACLVQSITKEQIENIGQGIVDWYKELTPSSDTHVFFLDSAFEDDVSKTNMTAILEQNGIIHMRSL